MNRTLSFSNEPTIVAVASMVGPKEAMGPLAAHFDVVVDDDLLGQETWELAEAELQRRTISLCLKKAGMTKEAVGVLLCGDLLNQIMASSFSARALRIPFLGLYGACSTMIEGLILGAVLVDGGYRNNAICSASSHFCAAERQFRFPLEMGNQRTPSAQWTATACGAALIMPTREDGFARITHGTIGVVTDYQIKDANHMGAAMAPAVADTLRAHFRDTGRTAADYDVIITGDLGYIGREILLCLAHESGIKMQDERVIDCGASMYYQQQDAHAGGSGCGCVASVLCGQYLPAIKRKEIRRALVLGSGAMLSPTSSMQGESIPSISYAVALEGG